MRKTIITLLLAIAASVGTMFAWDYEHVQIGDLYYNLDAMDKTAEVTKEAYSGLTTANIPASVTYSGTTYSVTSIGEWTFMGCSSLTSVTIPNSVTSIGDRAFSSCSRLTSVTIPNSVTSIGGDAFEYCSSLPVIDNLRYADTYLVEAVDKTLSSYSIKEGTKWIGDYAFRDCSTLTSVTIPNSVTSIGAYAFYNCSSLTYSVYNAHVFAFMPTSYTGAYTIPEGIESIAGGAFSGCSNLTSVTIPNSVKTLGYWAFANCSVLNHVEFPNSIEYCEPYVFRGCPDISTPICNSHVFAYLPVSYTGAYTIPDGIKIVAGGSCAYCDKLTSVTIPNSVKSINAQAFYQCSNLEYVSLGDNLEKIEFGAFYGCYKLLDVHFPNSLKLITGSRMGQGGAFEGCSGLTSVTIPNSVTSVGEWAFAVCSSLTSIEIPNSVTSIGGSAFYGCSSLTSVTIPNSVTSIGGSAFSYCNSLTSVTIGNSVTSIGESAFSECSKLIEVTNYATTPQAINSNVFSDVDKSIPLYVPAESVEAYKAADGWKEFTNIQAIPCLLASGTCGAQGDNLTWELSCDSVLTISGTGAMADWDEESSYAPWFDYKYNIKYVSLPDVLPNIGNYAFKGCRSLTSIEIPNSVTRIGDGAFFGCFILTSIEIPNSVTSIGEGAFTFCWGLTSVTIPNSVTSIEEFAFDECRNLTSIDIPNSVISIGRGAFVYCYSLVSVTIPNSVTSIGESAFRECTGMTSVTIGNNVTSIGKQAFYYCTGMTSVTIPNSVTSIGDEAFQWCSGLTSVTNYATTPQAINSNVFSDVDKSIPLYVSAESIDAYKAADGWKEFTNILPIGGMDIDHPTNPGTYQLTLNMSIDDAGVLTGAGMYAQGTEVSISATANTGYTFERWSDGVTNASRTITLMRDSTLTAVFTVNRYTVTFVDEDGTTVLASAEYEYGATPVAPADPTKAATAQYTYTFTGWSPEIVAVTGAAIYTATYSQTVNKYTVTFVDEDGTTVLASDEYEYGATPVAPADPTKAATAQYTYTFTGWSPAIANVTGAATYTATYSQTVNKYTVTFVDEDGTTVLSSDEYDYGATPVAPADPTKAATAQYTYTFTGWSPAIANVTGTATYTATYSQTVNKYTITFMDEDGTTVLASAEYEYGATPVAPADPTKAATEEYTYTFSGWDKTIAVVTEAATYTATYSSQLNNVDVTGDQDLADLPVGENTHITVGEDGNLTVNEPTTIGTITVTVNGDEASEIIGVENLTVTNAEMILRLEPNKANATPNKWYAFSVPFEVEVSGGIYAQGSASPAIYNSAFVLDEYDGSLRASTQQGWKRVASSAVLQPGVLYMIAVGSTTNEWRFVKRASAPLTEQTSLSVAAYPSAIGAHHAGWNGLANTLFRDASVALDGVQYITTYNNEQSVYEVQPIVDATLAMAKPFFVQVPQAGTLYLTAQPAGVAARSLMAADEQSPSCVLSLSSADFTDRAYITAQVGKENTYSIGHDLMKMLDGTPSVPQLWLEGYNVHLAAYELALTSESTTFIIPLGLYAPQNGTYMLDADTQSDYYTLTLLADDTPVAELGEQAVSIDLEQGNNSKYALRITKKADVVTNIINGTADGTQVVKFVQDDLLYILRDGKTYTIQGVEVK